MKRLLYSVAILAFISSASSSCTKEEIKPEIRQSITTTTTDRGLITVTVDER